MSLWNLRLTLDTDGSRKQFVYLEFCLYLSISFLCFLCTSGLFFIWDLKKKKKGKNYALSPGAPSLVLYGLKFKSKMYPLPQPHPSQHLYMKEQRRLTGPPWISIHPEPITVFISRGISLIGERGIHPVPITAFKLIDTSLIGQRSIYLSLGWSKGAVTDNLTLTIWTGGGIVLQGKAGRKGSCLERNKKCPSYPWLVLWIFTSFLSFHSFGYNHTLPYIGDVYMADLIIYTLNICR